MSATAITTPTPSEIVREACRVIWTEGETDRIAEFYSEDFHADYPMTDWGEGLPGAKKLADEIRAAYPDYREEIEEIFEDGDTVIVRLKIRGTHTGAGMGLAPTGKAVEFRDVTIATVRDGRIVHQRGLSDLMTCFLQLGVVNLPTP